MMMSRNETSKIALRIEDYIHSEILRHYKIHDDWNRLEGTTFFVGYSTLTMFQSSFYFRMIELTTNHLIDTGIMAYLVEAIAQKKVNIKRPKDPLKVLKLKDLSFGFNIWFGFCCISVLSFVFEILNAKLLKKCKKHTFGKFNAKVYPIVDGEIIDEIELKPQTVKCFKVKNSSLRTENFNDKSDDIDFICLEMFDSSALQRGSKLNLSQINNKVKNDILEQIKN